MQLFYLSVILTWLFLAANVGVSLVNTRGRLSNFLDKTHLNQIIWVNVKVGELGSRILADP
jgi:hypothetical protein